MPSSIHSVSGRSINSIASTLTTRSRKSTAPSQVLQVKWWQRRPIVKTAYFLDLQKGSYAAAIYTLVESILLLLLSAFDLYCLIEARPGSKHFRSFGISFLFVYSGNRHIRRALIATSAILIVNAIVLFVTSSMIIPALKKEYEVKFRPWLYTMAAFVVIRFVATIFQSIVNDLYFTYHQVMLILWFVLTIFNVFALLVVYSNYQELSDITKIEDMAKLKMSTLSSIQGSRSLSHMSNHSLDSSYKHYGATINSNPSPSYMRSHHVINHQPAAYSNYTSANANNTHNSGLYGAGLGSVSSTPTPSVLAHHSSTPSLRGGSAYTIPLQMFDLNRPASVTSSDHRIDQEFI